MNWKVPFFDLVLGKEEKQAAMSVIDSNWLTTGPRIAEFEAAFADVVGGDYSAVAVSSATAALHLSLIALGIGPGDEVILPSLTFVACANAVRYVGATPIFADVSNEQDWNISASDVSTKITPRTRAIMVVHYAGHPCNIDAFVALCKAHDLKLIEDCSHALTGASNGKVLGTFGDTGCFSFFSNKNMTTGEGGMIVSRDQRLIARLRILRSHGITAPTYQRFKGHAFGYDVSELGYNYRMDEIRAAIGLAQLQKLSGNNTDRKLRDASYRALISARLPNVSVPFPGSNAGCSHHIFPVLLPGDAERRNATLREMGLRGIQCSVHYRPIHTFSAYSDVGVEVPITDRIAGSILTLPFFPSITDIQINLVVDALSECLSL
jgi:dTDP-4-amino-4,6-dideoxygalactose transaminase